MTPLAPTVRVCKDFPTGAVGRLARLDVYESPSGTYTAVAVWHTATSVTTETWALTALTLRDARFEALRAVDASASFGEDAEGEHVPEFVLPRGEWGAVGRPEHERHALHGVRVAEWRP